MATPAPDSSIAPARLATLTFGGYAQADQGLEGASFGPRVIARVLDYVVHYGTGFFSGTLFRFMLALASGGRVPLRIVLKVSHRGWPLFVAALLGAVAYQVVCTTVHGSTLGKWLLSLVVVHEDGSPCRLGSAIIREVGYFPDSIFFGIIAYVAMQRTRQHQRYGDQWAGTVVCDRAGVSLENLRGAGRFVLALMLGVMADAALVMVGLLVQLNS